MSARPNLGELHHVAYVVDDIAATVERLAVEIGAGPFFLIENVPLENVTSAGEPAEFIHHSAFGAAGDGVIELMQPVSLAPERLERAFVPPRPRVHHIGYVVPGDDVVGIRAALAESGAPEYLSSEFGGAVTTVHDTRATLGHDIEIHGDNEGLRGFFGMVTAAADGWDGSQPIRTPEL